MAKINLGSIPVGWVFEMDGKKYIRTVEEFPSIKDKDTYLSVCVPLENDIQVALSDEVEVDDSYAQSIPIMNLIMQLGDAELMRLQQEQMEIEKDNSEEPTE